MKLENLERANELSEKLHDVDTFIVSNLNDVRLQIPNGKHWESVSASLFLEGEEDLVLDFLVSVRKSLISELEKLGVYVEN